MATQLHNDLVAIKELISDPARWTQCHNARDSQDRNVAVTSLHAVKFCVRGAAMKVTDGVGFPGERENLKGRRYFAVSNALEDAAQELYGTNGVGIEVNDRMGHEAVMNILDHAIAKEV